MRPRNMDQINPSRAWRDKASTTSAAVAAGRKKMSDSGDVWQELKPELSRLSYGKCWYCESRQSRSDNAVDHFRPKSSYPWYAFSYQNYRFACSYCNSPHIHPVTKKSQGKHNHFPLLDNSPVARNEDEIDLEQPVLLDPCNAADVGLLDFQSDGTPCAKFPEQPVVLRRVTESIRLYNLDHPELIEQRRLLGLELKRWITRANAIYPKVRENDPGAMKEFESLIGNISRRLDDHAELSAFARRIVRNYRALDWIGILDT
jgi:uncharacterized protein (TIGR02646 family)